MKNVQSIRDTKVMRAFYKLENAIIVLSLAVIIILTAYNVILRYVFRVGQIWTDEFISFLLVLMSMLGMAVGVKEGSHNSLDSFVCKMPRKLQSAVYILDSIIVAVFLGYATFGGFRWLQTVKGQTMTVLRWPVTIMYSFVVIGCLFALVEHMINTVIAIRTKQCRFIPLEEQMLSEQTFDQSI